MARWAGEGNDWTKLMAQRQLREEDLIYSLLVSMRQAVAEKESNGTGPTEKPRELSCFVVENSGVRAETDVAHTQNFLRKRWDRGVDLKSRPKKRTASWATDIFLEHRTEAGLWASKGVLHGRRSLAFVDIGMEAANPGLYTNTWLGPQSHKEYDLVTGQNSLEPELESCGLLLETLRSWFDKSESFQRTSYIALDVSSLYKLHFRWNVLRVGGPLLIHQAPPTGLRCFAARV